MARRSSPRPAPTGPTLSDQLRRALALYVEGGVSIYRLGRMAGVDPSLVSRFLTGKRGFSSSTMDRVAASLGLTLAPMGAIEPPAVADIPDPAPIEMEAAHV